MFEENKPNELRIIRVFDAPVETVWDAWTDLAQVSQWWGPRGFTITTHSKDLRAGGHWKYTMHGPDGVDWPNNAHYFEVEKYKKLVYDHGATDDQPALFHVTVLFSKQGDKTKMDMTMALPTADAAEQTRKFVKKAGGNGTWDRLAEYVEKKQHDRDVFFIVRTFDAPIDLVYDLWTKPEHFSKWLPPTGFTMEFLKADIRPGGSTFYVMSNGAMKMYGKAHYLEMNKPDRLVYTQQFADEHGNISRHPMAPVWPATMLSTVLFTAESVNQTRVSVRWEPYGPTTPAELEVFLNARAGMTQGWTGSFDKLEELIGQTP